MRFSRQEYWSGLPGDLPDPGIKPASILFFQARILEGIHLEPFLLCENLKAYMYMCVCMCWRRQWQPTPVLLPGKSHGWRSLVGCSPWGREELDMTEPLHFHFTFLHWRRKWQPTPVFLPGESQGRGSLVGCHLWGRTESDMNKVT